MKFYYVNAKGQRLNFYESPYLFQEGDLLDFSWSYSADKNRVEGFHRENQEKTIKIAVLPDYSLPRQQREKEFPQLVNNLWKVLDRDPTDNTWGKLWTESGYYLTCCIAGSEKSDWNMGLPVMFNTFKLVTPVNAWIKEETRSFLPQEGGRDALGLGYEHDYEYDYASDEIGYAVWETDHYAPSDYQMTVYGPCTDPRILVNGRPIAVYDRMEANEYLVIDSRDHTVMKHLANGTLQSLYDMRQKAGTSIFDRLSGGTLVLNWSGTFGFDLTLFKERSEPEWN